MEADNLSLNGLAARASEQKTDNEENIERVYWDVCVYHFSHNKRTNENEEK